MTDGDRQTSGELSSFLHLTGWRPLVLALIAGVAGAIGLFGALSQPAEWQARYTLNASRVADDDFTPQQLDIFAEEIALTGRFPQVATAVELRTGLVIEEDYDISINQSGTTLANVDFNAVAERPEEAQQAAIESGIEAMNITLEKILGGHESSADQINDSVRDAEATIRDLTVQANGINPSTAYDLSVQAVIDRRVFIQNPPTITTTDADGNTSTEVVPEPAPPLEDLEAEANRLEPLDRAFRNEIANLDALNLRLADRNNDIRDTNAALALVATELEDPLIISEVATEETSRIAGLLTGLLLYAIPAALITILLFVIWDALRRKPEEHELRPAEEFEPAGVLEASGQRALPEGDTTVVTPLTVVDEEDDLDHLDVGGDVLADDDVEEEFLDDDDDPEPTTKKRSKDGRWGRDASSKAG